MIKPLTSLRFFFALIVFVAHFKGFANTPDIYSFFSEGKLGVSFFFVLSGFVLSLNYQQKFIERKTSFKDFTIGWISRIYPLHILTLLLSILIYSKFSILDIKLFFNAFLLQSFVPIKSIYFSYNAPSWSISNEMFFYLIMPFVISVLYRLRLLKSYKTLILLPIFGLLLLFAIYFLPEKLYHAFLYINPVIRISDFILGIMLFNFAEVLKLKKINWKLIEVLSVVFFLVFYLFHNDIQEVYRYSIYYWIPICGVILSFSFSTGVFSKILSHRLFILLGEISFGFYMYHYLIIHLYKKWFGTDLLDANYVFIILVIVTTLISYISYILFEKPVNIYLKKTLIKK